YSINATPTARPKSGHGAFAGLRGTVQDSPSTWETSNAWQVAFKQALIVPPRSGAVPCRSAPSTHDSFTLLRKTPGAPDRVSGRLPPPVNPRSRLAGGARPYVRPAPVLRRTIRAAGSRAV